MTFCFFNRGGVNNRNSFRPLIIRASLPLQLLFTFITMPLSLYESPCLDLSGGAN